MSLVKREKQKIKSRSVNLLAANGNMMTFDQEGWSDLGPPGQKKTPP